VRSFAGNALRAGLVVWAVSLATAGALSTSGGTGPVRVRLSCDHDSLRVGERVGVTYRFEYPDSLRLLPPLRLPGGRYRLLDWRWREGEGKGRRWGEARIVATTLDLERLVVPPFRVGFLSAGGDTLWVEVDSLSVPVRHTVAATDTLRPIAGSWEPPRTWWPWVAGALVSVGLGALGLWLRRRRREEHEEPVRPALPPHVEALRALAAIERERWPERGETKRHYSEVVDVLRRYLERRFGVEAMERTTEEILEELRRHRVELDGLEALLRESDLVKFAKFQPPVARAMDALERVRRMVRLSTPREGEAEEGRTAEKGGAG
jgi:hypothetical protein